MMLRTKLPKYVNAFTDHRDKSRTRYYLRRPGFKKVPLPGLPWSPTFMAAYEAAMSGPPAPVGIDRVKPGSFRAVAAGYFVSSAYLSMVPASRQTYRLRIDQLCQQKDSVGVPLGDKSAAKLERKHIVMLMQTKADKPAAANELRKILRAVMQYAVEAGIRDDDPTRAVKPVRTKSDGFHSWTDDEIAQYETHHPVGSKSRLALALPLFTGQRRSDVVGMGRQHVRNGAIMVHQQKTGAQLDIPLHPDLAAIIAATPSDHLTFLTDETGKPFTAQGFGKWFRVQCDAADLPHCTAHGLRKAAARRLAEAGCSTHEIAAITGHVSLQEVSRYTKAVDQKRLAAKAMARTKNGTSVTHIETMFVGGDKKTSEIKGSK